ncbi:MAG: XRE family transcriptional regulator [Betaproteobacteria bacterium]|jgi:transcriptional regulator with XRE-family HTH domain|nr:XRE family transcriptional regulator [Betaproteobacteria bacterium]
MVTISVVSEFPSRQPHRPSSARVVLSENIRALRTLKGWSQEALALEAGLHRTFIAHVERCARNIALDNIEKLALALDVDTYELLHPAPLRVPVSSGLERR